MISKHDMKMFQTARKLAKQANFDTFHIGCVITYKKKIIGFGNNSKKTHPKQAKYNKYRHFNKTSKGVRHSLHAEIAAINNISYVVGKDINWSKVKVYVYRISEGRASGKGMARCCPACMQALKDLGIQHLYYTTNKGYAYEKIDTYA